MALDKKFYEFTLLVAVFIVVILFVSRWNLVLKSVEEDRFIANFAYISTQFLFKDVSKIEIEEVNNWNTPKSVGVFSIRTVKNKDYEVYYTISSGDFEKIQEAAAKAQLQMGSSNTPE
ncbi:hypothetical protein [Maridesulfovibrio frigidus]|uniref:hypothetical protein n=1 Tax=Maridesulfovibrio frigidus TaxID=340956 RepID=UPI0004E27204|nr:hypothetical protein [Maridesulfovibrio frigidus]